MSTTAAAPFDARHRLDPQRPHDRESMVWVLALGEERIGAVAYTWVDAHGAAGAAGIAFGPRLGSPVFERVDDVQVPDSDSFAAWEVAGMRISHDGPQRAAHIEYTGERLSMSLDFTPMGDPYAYSSHQDPFPVYFADERLEQGGRAVGTVTLDGEVLQVDGFAHRDHSWGARNWGRTLHYKWLNVLADDTSIHLMDLHGLGRTDLRGYVHKDGTTSPITAARFHYTLDEDAVHRRFAMELDDEAGRTTRARLTDPGATITYPIDPRMTLVDVVGAAEVDGSEAVSYLEMAWPPEYLAYNEGTADA